MFEVFDAVFEFLLNVNPLPYVIIIILLLFIISAVVQLKQIENVTKRFQGGASDDRTVKLCVRYRKRFIFPKSAELHDLFCCRLCALHMERNEEDLFFANINDIKKITELTAMRLHMVLAAYLTKQRYLDWFNKYGTTRLGKQSAADWLKSQQLSYDEEQLKKAAERITNAKVLDVLKTMTEE